MVNYLKKNTKKPFFFGWGGVLIGPLDNWSIMIDGDRMNLNN